MQRENQSEAREGSTTPMRPHVPDRKLWIVWVLGVVTVVCIAVILLLGVVLHVGGIGPSEFAPVAGPNWAAPGSTGCPQASELVCYSFAVTSSLQGLTLAHLSFRVANITTWPGYNATSVALGPGAHVTILGPSNSSVGVWWFSNDTWTSGAGWEVPTDTNVGMVLDTGLFSNSTLVKASFAVDLTSPFEGQVGFPFIRLQS